MKLSEYFAAERGAQARLAKQLQAPASLLSAWASEDPEKRRPIPVERCPAIERGTAGAVTVEELPGGRPWASVPDSTWPHPLGRPVADYGQQPTASTAKEAA